MKPVIGIDLDSVLCDPLVTWARVFRERRCGTHDRSVEIPVNMVWDFWEKWCPSCWWYCLHSSEVLMSHPPLPLMRSYVRRLERYAELHVITSRSCLTHQTTLDWLAYQGMDEYFALVVSTQNKAEAVRVSGAIALLDDAPHNILSVEQQTSAVPIIMDMPYNRHLPHKRVLNWSEAFTVLRDLAMENCRSVA